MFKSYFRVPYVDIAQYEFDFQTVQVIPKQVAQENCIVVLENHPQYLTVCMSYEKDEHSPKEKDRLVQLLEPMFNKRISLVKSTVDKICDAINKFYPNTVESEETPCDNSLSQQC